MQLSKDQKIAPKLLSKGLLNTSILSYHARELLKVIKEFKNKKREWLEVVEEVIVIEEEEDSGEM